ncbi:MAG: SO_0444 family Cu/Zn efflux transporter [Rikenellaceae bacterium]
MEYFNELLSILNAMSPYLLLGFLVAGLLHVYVPQTAYSKYLSKKGFKSVFLSALFGVPLPLCSCGVIPTAMSLKKEGASDGATVSFLIATPQTGVDSILATYGVFGLPFAIVRPIVAFVVALLGGSLVNRFSREYGENMGKSRISPSNNGDSTSESKRPTVVDALKYGFVDMLQDLGGWLTVGLVIAAAITAFVPSSVFEVLGDYYILNILVVLLLSIPMYICSTGSIPIALSLLMMGVSPGATLIFLMAGPATNVATLTVLRKVLGARVTLLYLLSIILGAIVFAVFIDFALPAQWFVPKLSIVDDCGQCGGDVAVSWWHLASSILFVVLLINSYILKFFGGVTHTHGVVEVVETQRFTVGGMRCNHCKANVEKAIVALPGVIAVDIDLTSGIVEVEGSVSKEAVYEVVRPLGFEIDIL